MVRPDLFLLAAVELQLRRQPIYEILGVVAVISASTSSVTRPLSALGEVVAELHAAFEDADELGCQERVLGARNRTAL
jgi:hypothetical protein